MKDYTYVNLPKILIQKKQMKYYLLGLVNNDAEESHHRTSASKKALFFLEMNITDFTVCVLLGFTDGRKGMVFKS